MKQSSSSPASPDPLLCMACTDQESLFALDSDEEPEVDLGKAMFHDPIVGVDKVLLDEHGPGALTPHARSSPRPMTAAEKAIHDVPHLP